MVCTSFWSSLSALLFATCLAMVAGAQDPAPTTSRPGTSWTGVLDEAAFAALHELKQGEAPSLRGGSVDVGDAQGYLSLPKGKPRSAVLVIHEWWGLNDHIKHWTDRLAADGYAALAIDLYGGTVATTRDGALEAMRAVDEAAATVTLREAFRFLKEDARVGVDRIACIGWCFGGGWSLRLAMAEPQLAAAVVYYGRLVTEVEQLAKIQAPLLGVFGNNDRGIPRASVDAFEAAMRKAGRSVRVLRYEADHAFANPSSARYDQEHAKDAWREVRAFLRESLRSAGVAGEFRVGARTFTYRRPRAWTDAGAKSMRAVNLKVGDKVECYVTVLGGNGGGLDANIDRWCQQMGRSPFSAAERAELPRLPMLGGEGVKVRLEGDYAGMRDEQKGAMLLGTVCLLDDAAVFVKMLGPKADVAVAEQAFDAFCRSMR